jgi:hypothetical protein
MMCGKDGRAARLSVAVRFCRLTSISFKYNKVGIASKDKTLYLLIADSPQYAFWGVVPAFFLL